MVIWHWVQYRILGRCFVCCRLMVAHSPWSLYICERTPLPIEITEESMEHIGTSPVETPGVVA